MDIVLNVFKESGYTSRDVVNILQRNIDIKKIGHAGTLDPDACGVLGICIGKATRIIEYLMDGKKTYIAEMMVGVQTDTGDTSGKIINRSRIPIDVEKLKDQLNLMSHTQIYQIPPMYSAIKIKGKRLYEYARENIEVSRNSRKIQLYNMSLLQHYKNRFILKIECSKGTYIRTLLEDIAKTFNTVSCMSYLMRVQTGNLKINQSYRISQIDKNTITKIGIPIDQSIIMDSIHLNTSFYQKIINGVKLYQKIEKPEGIYKIYCNEFIGIGEYKDHLLKMKKVLVQR